VLAGGLRDEERRMGECPAQTGTLRSRTRGAEGVTDVEADGGANRPACTRPHVLGVQVPGNSFSTYYITPTSIIPERVVIC
jgi:hypothetical protein